MPELVDHECVVTGHRFVPVPRFCWVNDANGNLSVKNLAPANSKGLLSEINSISCPQRNF